MSNALVTNKKSRASKMEVLTKNPETMNTICAHVAGGGSMVDLCSLWGLPYGTVMNWIHADESRDQRFALALVDRDEWSKESVMKELQRIALSDIKKLFREDGSMLPPSEWPDELANAVSTIEVDELFEGAGRERKQIGWTKRVRFWDKLRAIELIGKKLGLFKDRVEHSGELTLADLVAAAGSEAGKTGQDGNK